MAKRLNSQVNDLIQSRQRSQAALGRLSARREGGFLRLTLQPAMLPAAAELIAAEAICCSDARFALEVTAGQVILAADFPAGPANQAEPS